MCHQTEILPVLMVRDIFLYIGIGATFLFMIYGAYILYQYFDWRWGSHVTIQPAVSMQTVATLHGLGPQNEYDSISIR